jgi:hypothetical protein
MNPQTTKEVLVALVRLEANALDDDTSTDMLAVAQMHSVTVKPHGNRDN